MVSISEMCPSCRKLGVTSLLLSMRTTVWAECSITVRFKENSDVLGVDRYPSAEIP